MKIDMGKVSYDGRWYDHGEARLKIRPYPLSRAEVAFRDGSVIISGDASWDMFDYCLIEWENVTGADGAPLKLNTQIKKQIYDFRLGKIDGVGISDFVLAQGRKLTQEVEEDTKN